jgi:acyl-coenzyme A synthetase/AMP-(fatty) acid ligase
MPAAELHHYAKRFGVQFLISEPEGGDSPAAFARDLETFEFGGDVFLRVSRFALGEDPVARMTLRGVPMLLTSGSTGAPKMALLPAMMECAARYSETMDLSATDRIFSLAPMNHSYGFGIAVGTALHTGASVLTTRNFSVQSCIRMLAERSPTILPLNLAILDALVMGRVGALRTVRWTFSGGSPLTQKTAQRFRDHTGIMPRPAYGATETGGIALGVGGPGDFVDGRIGQPMRGVEIQARKAPGDDDVNASTLFVRSSSAMTGYLDDNDRLFDPRVDGWLPTGDLVQIEPGGVIALRGRNSDVINLSGNKVVPVEVEEAIAELPGVVEVKVYKGEHAFGQQIVKAAIAVKDGLTEADIREHCKQRLVYYKRPHTVKILDSLPRTAVGKIDTTRLP